MTTGKRIDQYHPGDVTVKQRKVFKDWWIQFYDQNNALICDEGPYTWDQCDTDYKDLIRIGYKKEQ